MQKTVVGSGNERGAEYRPTYYRFPSARQAAVTRLVTRRYTKSF